MIDFLTSRLNRVKNRHFLVLDIVLFPLATLAALFFRLEDLGRIWAIRDLLFYLIPTFTLLKVTLFFVAGLYQRYWRYASVDEFMRIGIVIASVIFFEILLQNLEATVFVLTPHRLPLSIPPLDGMLTFIMFSSTRYTLRILIRYRERTSDGAQESRILIIGAGEAGVKIAEEMQRNPRVKMHPVAFLDDDPLKVGSKLRGIWVLDTIDQLPKVRDRIEFDEVLIAIPSATGGVVKNIVNTCLKHGFQVKILPGFSELLDGSVALHKLRKIKIDDLLRRDPIRIDCTDVANMIHGKRVLITGGGGSIGSELARQIRLHHPENLVLVGHGENSIFEIISEMKGNSAHNNIQGLIGDIRDLGRMEQIIAETRPQIIFHAAAHKHVPLMEWNVVEAVTNNILGTLNLCKLATRYNVEKLVMISSDKAVRPTNIMGATKRVAEMLIDHFAHKHGCNFVAVRFGNVLGSRGSVVPFFQAQIARGGPVTVTDPNMTRYFMTIPEAVQLVLQAATMGDKGDLYILDMGEPVRILDLARDMIRLSGLEADKDIRIVFTGLRPGEKMTEELQRSGEKLERTRHNKIFRCVNGWNGVGETAGNGWNSITDLTDDARFLSSDPALLRNIMRLRASITEANSEDIIAVIGDLVPDFNHSQTNHTAIASVVK